MSNRRRPIRPSPRIPTVCDPNGGTGRIAAMQSQFPLPHGVGEHAQLTMAGENQGQRMSGDFIHAITRVDRYGNPRLGSGRDIDIVVPGTISHREPAFRESRQDFPIQGRPAHQQSVRVTRRHNHLGWSYALSTHELDAGLSQRSPVRQRYPATGNL